MKALEDFHPVELDRLRRAKEEEERRKALKFPIGKPLESLNTGKSLLGMVCTETMKSNETIKRNPLGIQVSGEKGSDKPRVRL